MSLFNPHQGVHGELGPKLLGKMAFTLGIEVEDFHNSVRNSGITHHTILYISFSLPVCTAVERFPFG